MSKKSGFRSSIPPFHGDDHQPLPKATMSCSQASGLLRQASGAFRTARQASARRATASARPLAARRYTTQNTQNTEEPPQITEHKEPEEPAKEEETKKEPEESEEAKKLKAKEQEVVDLTVRNGLHAFSITKLGVTPSHRPSNRAVYDTCKPTF